MNNGFPVIDADRHVMEPSDLWDRYLEPEFKGRVKITGPFHLDAISMDGLSRIQTSCRAIVPTTLRR